MTHLAKQLPGFSNLVQYVSNNDEFVRWMELVDPEHHVPECWTTKKELSKSIKVVAKVCKSQNVTFIFIFTAPVGKAVYKMLVIQAFRMDRLLAMAHILVATVLGESFLQEAEQELNLTSVVQNEVNTIFRHLFVIRKRFITWAGLLAFVCGCVYYGDC